MKINEDVQTSHVNQKKLLGPNLHSNLRRITKQIRKWAHKFKEDEKRYTFQARTDGVRSICVDLR